MVRPAIGFTGIGAYLPPTVLTNEDLENLVDTSDDWIRRRTGIETRRVLGGGIVGAHAGDLIAEIVHAIEMGSEVADLALTVHPHPTLAETVGLGAEVGAGTVTDLYVRPRRSAG